jgi:hypothetical protein
MRSRRARTFFASFGAVAFVGLAAPASAEEYTFGGSLRGHGGIVSADSSLSPGLGMDAPDPLRGADPRAAGVRPAGGFGSEPAPTAP